MAEPEPTLPAEERLVLAQLLEDRDLITESLRINQRQLAVVSHALMLVANGVPAADVRAYVVDERALLEVSMDDQMARLRGRLPAVNPNQEDSR